MNEWIKANLMAIIIGLITLASSYTIYGYRITALEERAMTMEAKQQVYDASNVQIQIDIAKIQTDISYIKIQLDRVFPPIR